ncbi:uncharacterized protein VP01_4645g3 [Puccinia sorghi]|uniref:Uncharacterized protein n=1 Tax=Puccinia sorghi TaxID=27349 RepID=A0A0L6UN97_9BASI|nr:uncharacterized protein VP01_4645g3 [Puccinia sorghi]
MNQRLRGINLGRTVLAGLNRRTSHHQTYSTRITSKRTATAGVAGLALAIPLTIYYVVYGRTLEAGREEEVYPAAIRRLLRAALMAEHGEEDQGTAARLFGEAYSAAKPLMAAGSLRWYDGAAIAIRWADLCERTGQRQAALLVLDNLIADLRSVWPLKSSIS